MARDYTYFVNRAEARLEAGFKSSAEKEDAIKDIGLAYEILRDEVKRTVVRIATAIYPEPRDRAEYDTFLAERELPPTIQHVRPNHLAVAAHFVGSGTIISDLQRLSDAVQAAEIEE